MRKPVYSPGDILELRLDQCDDMAERAMIYASFLEHAEAKIDKLERELEQQRFNNKHNLSIDQKISDQVAELEKENKKYREALGFIENWNEVDIAPEELDCNECKYFDWCGKNIDESHCCSLVARQALNK